MSAKQAIQWLYFNPFYGEAKIEADGHLGILESGVNLALWGGVAGGVAHLLGSRHAVAIGAGVFSLLVLAEITFGTSGPSSNDAHLQMAAPPTATPGTPYNGTPGGSPNFAESGAYAGFGEAGGFTQS